MADASDVPAAPVAGGSDEEYVRQRAAEHVSRHTGLITSAQRGRVLSAVMLPVFRVRPPAGFGVITTTGRKTGKPRRKCIRAIRRGDHAYLVQLRPPQLALERPGVVAAWVWNIRSNPRVDLRTSDGSFRGVARELRSPAELAEAREIFCETVHLFDFGECEVHLRGLPSREKVMELHRYWFDTGVPLVVDLERSRM
jgi:deazaflavin-dependent oxidoreductase (nitroreductase family)